MRRWIIEKLGGHIGGFETLDDAIEAIRAEENPHRKHEILTLAVKKIFNTVSLDDILRIHGNSWTFEGRPLRDADVKRLQAETTQFQTTFLWKVIQKEFRYQGIRRLFLKSASELDLVAAKLLIYSTNIIDTKLKSIAQSKTIETNEHIE